MNKFIVVTTLCNKEEIANKIIDTVLQKHLASGAQISNVHSKYWWNDKYEECDEIKIEFRTKSNLFNEIKNVIKEIHDYEVAEISSYEITDANQEFLNWVDENTK